MAKGPFRPWPVALGLIVVGVLSQGVLAAVVPLFPDETYYWVWSRHLAFGYFDHPPAIAFLIAAGAALLGPTAAGIRLGAVLAGGIGSLAIVVLTRRLAGDAAALRASIVLLCMPLALVELLATPDAPLMLAAALTFLAVDRALTCRPGSWQDTGWWVVAGATAGLGLMAKLTGLLIPFGITLAFVLRADLRNRLATPGPWVSAAVALALFSPFLAWNAANGWISFMYQVGHGLGTGGGSALMQELDLLGAQAAVISPILFVMIVMAVAAGLRASDPRRGLLAISATAIAGVFILSALRKPVHPNWLLPVYVPGTVLLAAHVTGWRAVRWFRGGAFLGGLLVAGLYAQAFVPWMPFSEADDDPLARAHGWGDLAVAVAEAGEALSRERGCGAVWLGARTYQAASQTTFHLTDNPVVFSTNLQSRPNQYDLWPGFADRASPGDCLVLFGREPGTAEAAAEVGPHFRRATQAAPVRRTREGREIAGYNVWLLVGWTGDAAPFR